METYQALNCLKALTLFERHISFEHVNELVGYTIRIEGLSCDSDRKMIRHTAEKLNLTVKEDTEGISIQ
ncbi:hypothetical protein GX563_05310 [Candidatus Bathyarchaeota archaeon]|nr:hypothetical protein [Candidatus Bathyarchaeota archaeon]